MDDLQYVSRAIERVAKHFAPPRPDGDQLGIIGFCGAPFTLASYMIEGGSSRNYIETKKMMYASASNQNSPSPAEESAHPERSPEAKPEGPRNTQPHPDLQGVPAQNALLGAGPDSKAWPLLMAKLVKVLTAFAAQQVEAGADVIQVFDSWAGALSPTDYRQFCLAPTTELIQSIRALGVPVIYFGVDTASLLPAMQETGADVLGLDWRIPLDQAWHTLGQGTAVQGNLDPITLFAPQPVIESRVKEILTQAANRPGHIFNLGHGIVPTTPVDSVIEVVRLVRTLSQRPTSTKTHPQP